MLVDVIKIGSATLGSAAFQHLPIAEIERVEIVRGPRSAQYGSEAIGGVIQIFTRNGADKAITGYAEAGVGRYDSHNVEGGVSGTIGNTSYALSASFEETDGFNACNGAGAPDFIGCFTTEPDEDGYKSAGYSLRIDQKTRQAYRDNVRLALNPTTYTILELLCRKAPEVVTRQEISEVLWQENEPNNDVLRSHIYQLRNQMDKPFSSPMLITIPKVGFRLEQV